LKRAVKRQAREARRRCWRPVIRMFALSSNGEVSRRRCGRRDEGRQHGYARERDNKHKIRQGRERWRRRPCVYAWQVCVLNNPTAVVVRCGRYRCVVNRNVTGVVCGVNRPVCGPKVVRGRVVVEPVV